MKEFKLRFTADVADIEAQFKGAASELKKFAAGVASAENQLEALQQTGAYLAQMDKQLSELKKKYPDIFNKIFGNVDAQLKAALEPLMKSPKLVSKAVNMIGNQLSGISTGKLDATNTEMKKLGETVQTLAKTMGMQADLDFLNGTDKARLKAQKLIDVLSNLATAYYKLDKASDRTDIGKITAREDAANAKAGKERKTKTTKDKSVNKPAMAYDDLYKLVQESKELSKKIDEGDDSAFDSLDKKINKIAKAFKLSEDGIAQLDMMLQDTDQTVEETMGKLQKLLGEKFPQQVQTSDLESGFDKIESSAENTTQEMKEAADAARLKAEEEEKARIAAEASAKAAQEAAEAAKKKADEEERARAAANQLKEIKDAEAGTFYDSKTGKVAPINRGDKNSVSTDLNDFKNAAKNGYDTRIHSHLYNIAAPSISSTENDFTAWLQVFDYIKKQAIAANSEILTFDFSSLTKETLQNIAKKYEELAKPIVEDFAHPTPEKVQKWGGYNNVDEEMQRQLREVLDVVMKDYSGVMSSIPIADNNKVEIIKAETDAIKEQTNVVNDNSSAKNISLENEIKSYQQLIDLLTEYQNLEKQKKKVDTSPYDFYIDTQFVEDRYAEGGKEAVMKDFQDIWSKKNALNQKRIKSPEYLDLNMYEAAGQEIAEYEEKLKKLAAAYVDLGGSVDDFKSKEKRAFAQENVDLFNSQKEQFKAADEEVDKYNEQFEKRQAQIAKMLKADGTDIGNTAELIQNVENFRNVEESAKNMAQALGIEVPQATSAAGAAVEDLKAKADEAKTKFFELTKSLDSDLFAGRYDEFSLGKSQADLDKAQKELQELANDGHLAADAMEEVNAAYKKTSDAISASYEGIRNENIYKEESGSYENGYSEGYAKGKDEGYELRRNLESQIDSLRQELADAQQRVSYNQIGDSFGTESNAVVTNVQDEINALKRLEDKIFDVKHAVEQKIKAFVNEGRAVDSNVWKEIEVLDKLLNKINAIKAAVDDKSTAFKQEENAVSDSTKKAVQVKEKEITKKKEKDTFDTDKNKLADSVESYRNSLNLDFVSQDSLNRLAEMQTRLNNITNSDDLTAWKQDWNEVTKSISKASKEQEGLALSSQKTKLSGMKKSITDAYKGAAIDIDKATDEQKVFAQSYDELSSKLTFYAKNRRVLSNDEMAALEKEAKAIKEKANAYAKQADDQKKAENAYGTKEIKTAQSKKEKITGVATSDKFSDSQKVTSKLADMNAAYDALIAKQKEFKPGQETEDDRIAFQKLANDFNKAYQELSELVNESERLSKNSNWSKSLNPDFDISTYDGMRSALEDAVRSTEIGKVKIDDFNFSLRQLDYSVQNQDGSWSHFTAKLNATGTEIVGVNAKLKQTDNIFKRLFSGASNKFMQALTRFTGFDAFYKGINEVRKGIQYVKEIDLALTELKKVTDETEDTYANFLQTASKTSAVIGSTIADFTNATADFARLGYSISEATELAKAASVYKNVGDGIDSVEQATESIISTMKAFGIEADNSMAIVDKFNEVGNNFAISSTGIGEALQRSASALYESGNTIDESIALITAANSVVQNPEQVGTALKTLSLRLRGAKVELEEAGEDVDGMATSVSSLQEKLLALTHGKVNIMADDATFKNTTQILREMSEAWEEMTDIERAAALELMGGKRQA